MSQKGILDHYDTFLCSFPKSQQFCWQFQELFQAFLEQHYPLHTSIRVDNNSSFFTKGKIVFPDMNEEILSVMSPGRTIVICNQNVTSADDQQYY